MPGLNPLLKLEIKYDSGKNGFSCNNFALIFSNLLIVSSTLRALLLHFVKDIYHILLTSFIKSIFNCIHQFIPIMLRIAHIIGTVPIPNRLKWKKAIRSFWHSGVWCRSKSNSHLKVLGKTLQRKLCSWHELHVGTTISYTRLTSHIYRYWI